MEKMCGSVAAIFQIRVSSPNATCVARGKPVRAPRAITAALCHLCRLRLQQCRALSGWRRRARRQCSTTKPAIKKPKYMSYARRSPNANTDTYTV